jgi:hypothetical protein
LSPGFHPQNASMPAFSHLAGAEVGTCSSQHQILLLPSAGRKGEV